MFSCLASYHFECYFDKIKFHRIYQEDLKSCDSKLIPLAARGMFQKNFLSQQKANFFLIFADGD